MRDRRLSQRRAEDRCPERREGIMEDEDNDEVIRSPLAALSAIEKYGYLTRLETPTDEWYEIGTRPLEQLEQEEYGERILMKTAVEAVRAHGADGKVARFESVQEFGKHGLLRRKAMQPEAATKTVNLIGISLATHVIPAAENLEFFAAGHGRRRRGRR